MKRYVYLSALCLLVAVIAGSPDSVRAQSTSRFQVVKGIFVDIDGQYPSGFKPSWAIAEVDQDVPATYEQHVVRYGPSGLQKIPIRLGDIDGMPAILLQGYCAAIISDKPIILTQKPIIFTLSGFRNVRPNPRRPGCAKMSAYQSIFKGAVRLAADREGNVIVDLDLSILSTSGSLSYHYSVDGYRALNRMTPLMVRQELDRREIAGRKALEAAELAKRELAQLKAKASAGNIDAMLTLGRIYLGADATRSEGLRLLSGAVLKGDNEAAFVLAEDAGRREEYADQAKWYKVAAVRGVPEAMFNLGLMAKRGQGMPASLTVARTWMRQAGEKGHDRAIAWLKENSF